MATICPQGHHNPDASKFCSMCGGALSPYTTAPAKRSTTTPPPTPWQHVVMGLVGLLVAADFLLSPYNVVTLQTTTGDPVVIGTSVFPGVTRSSPVRVECGNGWDVLTDAKYKACEEQQGLVWVRLVVGGAIAYGLFKWGENAQKTAVTGTG